MKIKYLLCSLLLMVAAQTARADKGMWILNELNQQNIDRMRELGFNMSVDDLYNLDKPSLARAVVIFGGGCTGITVSDQGLIFTNHHCGYSAIQSQSTVNHDYLKDGFVSRTLQDELPIPGLSVRYLHRIDDVTDEVLKAVAGVTDESKRIDMINELSEKIAARYGKDDHIQAEVIPFYAGNKYYAVVYKVFNDVRMVMAPPSSVGKFGGDTDNWMWTRHTGDFSVFRVYADANNNPADYSANNRPYKPVSFAKVSLAGYRQGDYAMTIGFPGSTVRYLPSWGIEDMVNNEHNPRIEVRGIKQRIWREAMNADQATRIKYDSKYAQSSNYWKNAIGMNRGIKNLDVIARKQAEEAAFTAWVNKTGQQNLYGNILPELQKNYAASAANTRALYYLYEALWGGTELPRIASMVSRLGGNLSPEEAKEAEKELRETYKDYMPSLDQKVLPEMLKVVRANVPAQYLPDIFTTIDKKFKGNYERYAEYVFKKSVVPYEDKLFATLALPEAKRNKVMKNDPAGELMVSVIIAIQNVQKSSSENYLNIEKGNREYFAARRVMDPERLMPSDANFTMRMSYGSIKGYQPKDGAWYNYYTTEKGVFEKQDPTSHEFAVQPEILDLLRSKDFGQYGENGHLHLCFLSDNDITGGNSGSPVFNGNGELIGLAFDGNWEAMSGDVEFEPDLQRTISVDIRYVLFMIDKWAKCDRLIKELTLVETPVQKPCCKKDAAKACPKDAAKMCPKDAAKACPKDAAKACPKDTAKMCPKDAAMKKDCCKKDGKCTMKDKSKCDCPKCKKIAANCSTK